MENSVNNKSSLEENAMVENFHDIGNQESIEQNNEMVRDYVHIFLEMGHEPMLALTNNLRIIYANRSFYDMFKLEPGDTEKKLIYELSNKEWDIPKMHELFEDTLSKHNKVYDFKIKHEFIGVGQCLLAINAQRVIIDMNGTQMIIVALRDITELNNLTKGDEGSFSYLRETLESSDDGIVVVDLAEKIKVYNKRLIELFEIPDEIIATRDFKILFKYFTDHLSDPKRFLAITRELAVNQTVESFDIVETKSKIILEYYSKPQWIDKNIVGRVWSFRDITSRKWAENALKITYVSFHNIFESSRDGIIVVDLNGCLCYFNSAAEMMFAGKVDEQINEKLNFPISTDEIKEIEIKRSTGETGIAEMRIVETEWEGKSAYLAMLRDISERKSAEDELKKHQEHLEEEVKQRTNELIQAEKMVSLGHLVSGVAHEVNNPLAFIRSNTEYMTDMLLDLKQQFKEKNLNMTNLIEIEKLININLEGIYRISKITTALKRFAKPGATEKSFVDVNQGIKDTLLIVGNKLKHRIIVHENYGELPKILCNIEQLNQVFMNVLLNSSEAMGEGNIYIKTWHDNGNVYIEITDDGKGFPKDKMNKIFDPFFTTKEDGTGLGLSLSYRIMQAHDGNIKIESEVGIGTTVTIEFPMVSEDD